jgi:hypothetical protein
LVFPKEKEKNFKKEGIYYNINIFCLGIDIGKGIDSRSIRDRNRRGLGGR